MLGLTRPLPPANHRAVAALHEAVDDESHGSSIVLSLWIYETCSIPFKS
jgi:hypothetical protein